MYRILLKPILFLLNAEKAHSVSFGLLKFIFSLPGGKALFQAMYSYRHPSLQRKLFGLTFPNPVGLAAGFDKNGKIGGDWANLGFGFVEVGTVTPVAQEGNPLPRLFRLPSDLAVINRMGFNNEGMDVLVERLKHTNRKDIIIGGNIGKNKNTPNENAVDDYRKCFLKLHPWVDYFVVNVSSPNTPGLRELQDKKPLSALLTALKQLNSAQDIQRPILLKIAPDLSDSQLDDIIEIVQSTGIDGLVATNTTISRDHLASNPKEVEDIGAGGLSGGPLTNRSLEVVRYIHQKSEGRIPIIGVGGILGPGDAIAMLEAGASLIQVWTGFVYQGPGLAKWICKGIASNNSL